ncbi:hypothetical protein ACUH9H_06830 [Dermabacteraceae bacterium P13128]
MILLRSKRGGVGTNWWAVALRERLELLLGAEGVRRGKADARAGTVASLTPLPLRAVGEVSGFTAEVSFTSLPAPEGGAALLARAASGELPREAAPLVPESVTEISFSCSCPEWPGPCRHVAALCYVLVEAVDADPTHLFTLRGLGAEEVATADAPAPALRFAPELVDTRHLAGALGEQQADVFARFYTGRGISWEA